MWQFFRRTGKEKLKKQQQQLVNDYIFSSNSARKHDYIYVMRDMRTHRIIKTVKPCRHLRFKDFEKELHFTCSRDPRST